MAIPPERQAILKILPPDLIAALRQPMADADRKALINRVVSDQLVRIQALRYVQELQRRGAEDEASAPTDDAAGPADGDPPDA